MSKQLNLSLLGRVQADLGGKPLDLPGQKPMALLSYLATTGEPHTRETLSALLWGESTDQRAKASLRTALWHMSQSLEPFLLIDRQTVAFNTSAPHWVDVVEFEAIIKSTHSFTERHGELAAQTSLSEDQALRLAEAVSYYRGDFLAGFQLTHAPAFEDWMLRRREWANHLAVQALYQLVDHYITRRAYRTGIDTVTRLLVLAPWQEEAHRQRMLLLALSGQRNAALAQYETCRSILAEELDVEPTIETQLLYQKIKAGKPLAQEEDIKNIVSLHATSPYLQSVLNPSNLIGREAEIAELKRLLTDPTARMISLVGPAGAGKTRLALTVASQIAKLFDHGIGFVPILSEDVKGEGADLPQMIESDLSVILARVLGLTFSAGLPHITQIMDYLRYKNLLLILDDFVSSPARMQLVKRIIRYNRSVKLLIISTSSLPIDIEPEYVMNLEGMKFPDPSRLEPGSSDDLEGFLAYDCVNFLIHQTQSLSNSLEPTARNLRDVTRICECVAGLPLGIKLVTPWIGTVPLAEITRELKARLKPPRKQEERQVDHESVIENLLAYIWARLAPAEQQGLTQLTYFRGSFDQKAATEILTLSSGTLKSLANKGLLKSIAPERYAWHPLLRRLVSNLSRRSRQFSSIGENAPTLRATRYRRYFLDLLTERESALCGGEARAAANDIRTDWDHIRYAWYSAARHRDTELLDRSLLSLTRFLHIQNWMWEGAILIEEAVQSYANADEAARSYEDTHLIGRLSVEHARFLNAQRCHREAKHQAQSAIELVNAQEGARTGGNGTDLMASGHLEWGRALVAERAFEAAREHLTHALVIARDHELTAIKADTLTCMGILEIESVQFSAAQNTLREALTLYQNLQDCKGVSRTLNDLSRIAIERRTYKEAKQYAEEALSLAQTLGDHREQSNALRNIGTVAREEGRYAAASLNCEQALTIARNAGDLQRECEMLIELAILHLQDGKNEEAWKRGLLAVELARILNLPFHEGRAWLIAGHAFAEFKLFDQALQAYESALNLRSGMAQQGLVHEPLAGMARVYFSQGDIVQARILIEHILDHLNAEEQHKTSQTLRVYLTCYQVLEANDDPRASDILMKAAQIYGTGDQAMLGSAL